MENRTIDPATVNGWGVDADPKNDPTYPMKVRTNAEHAGYSWDRPPQQRADVEVLHSNERPTLSAVFGTSTPPSGISGMIRRVAFRFSENSYGHWLPLMLADRIGVVEGLVEDLARGHVPNVPGELGMREELRHDKPRLAAQVAIIGAGIGMAVYLRRRVR